MKLTICWVMSALALTLAGTGCVIEPIGVPPAPRVEVYGEPPFAGAIWVPGVWFWHGGHRDWEWRGGHWR